MKKYIPSLNGLRAISILCVIYSHVVSMNFGKTDNPGGQIGVNIFFVISGFLITHLLLIEESEKGKINLKQFYLRRTIRIFPPYYFVLLVYFILQRIGIFSIPPEAWLSSIFYVKSLHIGTDHLTMHFWSLSIEELFYLIWPFVFKYLYKFRIQFAVLVIISVTLVRLCTNINDMHLFTRADALMWGCVFAIFNSPLIEFLNRLHKKSPWMLVFPFFMLVCCMIIKRAFHLPPSSANLVRAFIGSFGLFTDIAVGFVILVSIHFKDSIIFYILNLPILNFIGKLSYSLYLWQQIFFSKSISPLSNFPLNLLMIAIVALMSYYWVEKPFIKLKSRFENIRFKRI